MKRSCWIIILSLILALLSGCAQKQPPADIAATTLPVYEFTSRIIAGSGLTVTRLVTENVSCLHDYSLNVRQTKAAEGADVIVISGAGLEDFMADLLQNKQTIDASSGVALLESCHHHDHDGHDHHEAHDDHNTQFDSHIWLSAANASVMARNICDGLIQQYPEHEGLFLKNLTTLLAEIQALDDYARIALPNLEHTEIITFHDGFSYLADWCGVEIVKAIEEEAGAEASAAELIEIIGLIEAHQIRVIFTETNGSCSGASVIAAETGAKLYTLDMAMSGDSWFDAMYHNIDTLKEALS